ncbi:metallophosphoesterase family protein [Ktedonobacter racemifer]|uniref:Metallophosphoesterase n=1 Tax=Ktedonobacter racemifer DSM 44963 TaxID=485913 RepID=D6TSD4_KTERA|nr:metallophosphoesterase [Ktedonobacter racemifer]EFH83335.1 metallophosphoesterase [Ktedonobacter racemifer DSM 44963]
MKLYAISDLHIGHATNRQALEELPSYPDDWLILAGDVGETLDHLRYALSLLTRRFARVIWVPGNHDLWTIPSQKTSSDNLRGDAKYAALVSICRSYGVLTPEDPYVQWPGAGTPYLLAPLFLLYDYSFRPAEIPEEKALEWALEADILCSDEYLLHPDPYPSRAAWCAARCAYTERRLQVVEPTTPLILINHFPLYEPLVRLKRIPRFSLWCGTRRTHDWHKRFPTAMVIYGHLHIPRTDVVDGVHFEEVSLGYPQQWNKEKGIQGYLRQILPSLTESSPR